MPSCLQSTLKCQISGWYQVKMMLPPPTLREADHKYTLDLCKHSLQSPIKHFRHLSCQFVKGHTRQRSYFFNISYQTVFVKLDLHCKLNEVTRGRCPWAGQLTHKLTPVKQLRNGQERTALLQVALFEYILMHYCKARLFSRLPTTWINKVT